MSLDRRLHEGIGRLTAGVDPDVERHLHTSLRSGRRRIVVRRVSAVAGTMAALALVAIAGPRLIDAPDTAPRPAVRPSGPSPSAVGVETIAGTYTVTVDPGPEVVDEVGLAGEWTIELRPDGSMGIEPPPGLAGPFEGYTFDIRDGRFVTDAFVNDLCNEAQGANQPLGTYRLEMIHDDLVLDAQSDVCDARVEILDSALLRAPK